MVRPLPLIPLHVNSPKSSKRRNRPGFDQFTDNDRNSDSMINPFKDPPSARSMSNIRNREPTSTTRYDHQRPRPISTGRMRGFGAENQSVTNAILGVLEKRGKHEKSLSKRSNSRHHLPPHRSYSFQEEHSEQIRAAHSYSEIQTRRSYSSENLPTRTSTKEKMASRKLKEAEDKISTLMDDLEELQFFDEISLAEPPKMPAKILGASPARRKNRFLSPRLLSGMERTSLELEAQELQRRLEISEEEKENLHQKVQSLERQAKIHNETAKRMQSVEKSLREVRGTIVEQMKEMHAGRIQLTEEFESELNEVNNSRIEMKEHRDSLEVVLAKTKDQLASVNENFTSFREKAKEKLDELQLKWVQKEESTEMQLDEITNVLDETQKTLAVRDNDIEILENKLKMHELENEKFQKKLADKINHNRTIEELLQDKEIQYKNLEEKFEGNLSELKEKMKCISILEETIETQVVKVSSLQDDLAAKEEKEKQQIEDLKQSHEVRQQREQREQRRLDELVESHHAKCTEYEERIADAQKQLTLANDRHEVEMEKKEMSFKERAEKIHYENKRAARAEYEPKLNSLLEEIESLQQSHDDTMKEVMRKQAKSESQDRDSVREMERRDMLRQGEMEILNDKLNRALRDVTEKEAKIQKLSSRLTESEERFQLILLDLESQQEEDSKTRDDLITQRKSVSKLRSELSRKEFEFAELRDELELEVETLRNKLEQKHKTLEENQRREKSSENDKKALVVELQSCLENTKKELISEKSRHESLESEFRVQIAKLDGKLSACESTLMEKQSFIETLEEKILHASKDSSVSSSKLHMKIDSLEIQLDKYKEDLQEEQNLSQIKDGKIACLEKKLHLSKKSETAQIMSLEEELASTQRLLEQAIDPNNDETMELREELESVQRDLVLTKEQGNSEIEKLEKSLLSSQMKITNFERARRNAEDKIKELEKSLGLALRDQTEAIENNEIHGQVSKIEFDAYETKVKVLEQKLKDKESEAHEIHQEAERVRVTSKAESEALKYEMIKLKMQLDSEPSANATFKMEERIEELEDELSKLRKSKNIENTDTQIDLLTLKNELKEKESKHQQLTEKLKSAVNDRAEAMRGLKEMVIEVQMRQEEYDTLANILETREDELENAKMIATKALASAEDIKARYMEKGAKESDRHIDLQLKIDELASTTDYLTRKNEKMRNRTSKLERELIERNKECAKLKDLVRQNDTKSSENNLFHSTMPLSPDKDGFISVGNISEGGKNDMSPFSTLDNDFSRSGESNSYPSNSVVGIGKTNDFGEATQWFQDFEQSQSVFSKDSSPGGDQQKKKKVGRRDSGNIFRRKRFLKRNSSERREI